MTELVVGVDVGATKLHLRAEDDSGQVIDRVLENGGWRGRTVTGRAQAIISVIKHTIPSGSRVAALVVGAHSCDSTAQCLALQSAIAAGFPVRCEVVNDAELIVPAIGRGEGIGVVSGTGSIAVGRIDGILVKAGGHGWMLGDDGGASGLVREAARMVLQAADQGNVSDVLGKRLCAALGASDIEAIVRAMYEIAPERWASAAPAIFAAAEEGSVLAQAVVDAGGEALARLVLALETRGVDGRLVVAGGGVIVHQPSLAEAFVLSLRRLRPASEVHVLLDPPVAGAVLLARRLLSDHLGQVADGGPATRPWKESPM